MKVLVNNQLIEYRDEGSGRVLLLLHGWGNDLATFDQMAAHLANRFRVVRFDFPGFGQSPRPADDWAVQDYARLTGDFMKKLKLTDLEAVICHSFGGRVVIRAVSHGFINPRKIILIGAAGVKPLASFKKSFYKGVAKVGKLATSLPLVNRAQPALRRRLHASAGSTDYLQAKQMQPIFLKVIVEDLLPEVSSLTQPTLLVWGRDDTVTPLADANLILEQLANGRLVTIDDAGHFVYVDAFNRVMREIDGFLV